MLRRDENGWGCVLLAFGVAFAIQSTADGQPSSIDDRADGIQLGGSLGESFFIEARPVVPDELTIIEARWGAHDGWEDVTERLRERVTNGSLSIADLNVILADVTDPKEGHDKALVVSYRHLGKTRMAIVASTAPTGRGGALSLPEKKIKAHTDPRAFHKKIVGTKWRIERNGLTVIFADGKYTVSDWGSRHGIWMVTGPGKIGGVGYEGSHTDAVFEDSFSSGTWIVSGGDYSKLTRLPNMPVIEPQADLSAGPLFESVFGVYGQAIRGKRHPFVNLSPPNRNLWTKDIEAKLKGVLSYGQVDYIGTAKLVIPETGIYTVDIPDSGTQFRLNGHVVAGDVKLFKGAYSVEIYTNHWGQPYLKYTHAVVFKKGSKRRIPFVNTGDALEAFLSQKIDNQLVMEVYSFETKRIETANETEE
jgi:hypothetical protein